MAQKGELHPPPMMKQQVRVPPPTVLIPLIEYFVQYKQGFLEALNNSTQQLLFDENKHMMEIQKLREANAVLQ